MPLPPTLDAPVSKLNRDLLWNIFTINVTDGANFSYPLDETHRSPLTTTRRCSQVCTLWCEIILESPSIWGRCIDLDTLVQGCNDWRDEVLRRTGSALLSVRARYENAIVSGTGLHQFLVDLIHEHWARIQSFDVAVESDQTLNDAKVWNAFSSPARYLREFSILAVENDSDAQDTMIYPASFCLFSDGAPLLTRFSIRNYHRNILPFGVRPFPSMLLTTQLQSLALHQPMELAAIDLLVACEQMQYLEMLAVTIRKLLPDDEQDALLPSRRHVTLPRLRAINLYTPNLEIYPAFLGRITTPPGCTLFTETTLDETEAQSTRTITASVQGMQHVFPRFLNISFDHHRNGIYPMTDLDLTLFCGFLEFNTYPLSFCLRHISNGDDEIPDHTLDSVLGTISTLNFPNTIGLLKLFMDPQHPRLTNTFLQLFLGLSSFAALVTAPICLLHLTGVLKSKTSIIFPLLKTVFLRCLDSFQNKEEYIKPFLADRQCTAPVEVLDFTKSHWPLGDLRFLDDLMGLRVVWIRDNVPAEYVCGSGNPEELLQRSDDINESDLESN